MVSDGEEMVRRGRQEQRQRGKKERKVDKIFGSLAFTRLINLWFMAN